MKLVLQIKDVPEGVEVTKPTGNKLYRVANSIKIYGENKKEIKADPGVLFLIDAHSNVTCVKDTMDVAIPINSLLELQGITELLEQKQEGDW